MHNDSMKNLTIRKVPDKVHGALLERARRNRRSLNQQVIAELAGEKPVSEDNHYREQRAEAMIRAANRVREAMPRYMTAAEIDAAKKTGRK